MDKKYSYKPTFWGWTSEDEDQQQPTNETVRRNSLHTPKKSWKAKPGEMLTSHEDAVLKAIAATFPAGELDHKAQKRDDLINRHLKESSWSPVSDRTIQRTLKKIKFA